MRSAEYRLGFLDGKRVPSATHLQAGSAYRQGIVVGLLIMFRLASHPFPLVGTAVKLLRVPRESPRRTLTRFRPRTTNRNRGAPRSTGSSASIFCGLHPSSSAITWLAAAIALADASFRTATDLFAHQSPSDASSAGDGKFG